MASAGGGSGQQPWLVIDGAHNGASAVALADTLLTCFPPTPRTLVFGTTRDKDLEGQLRALIPLFDVIIATRYVENPRSVGRNHRGGDHGFGRLCRPDCIRPGRSTRSRAAIDLAAWLDLRHRLALPRCRSTWNRFAPCARPVDHRRCHLNSRRVAFSSRTFHKLLLRDGA